MDVTTLIIEGQDARSRMQEAKRRNKAEVRRKYEARITQEVADLDAEAEYTFARTLARINASGLSQALIRREILRTNVWDRWTYWRDLAEIAPERVSIANAKAEREAAEEREKITFDWRGGVLYVLKNPVTGEKLPHEIAIPYFRESGAYWADGFDRKMWTTLYPDEDTKELVWFADGINREVKRAIEAGEVEVYNPWTYLNNEDNDDFLAELAREEKKMYDMNSWINEEGK